MLEKEFLVNLHDGRFAKLQIGLILAHDDTSTVAAGGHGAAPTPPEGYGAMAQEGVVRDVITDVLTDAKDKELIEGEGRHHLKEEILKDLKKAHRCKGRARPLLGRHRSVRNPHPMAETVDYAPFETTTEGPVEPAAAGPVGLELSRLHDVSVELAVEVGRTRMTIREALALGPGSIVTLNRLAGEPVDLLVNGKPIARGEVVVIDEEFGLRVTEVLAPKGSEAPEEDEQEA